MASEPVPVHLLHSEELRRKSSFAALSLQMNRTNQGCDAASAAPHTFVRTAHAIRCTTPVDVCPHSSRCGAAACCVFFIIGSVVVRTGLRVLSHPEGHVCQMRVRRLPCRYHYGSRRWGFVACMSSDLILRLSASQQDWPYGLRGTDCKTLVVPLCRSTRCN